MPAPVRHVLLIVFSAVLAASAAAQVVPASAVSAIAERFPSGSIRSAAQADVALAEAASERADIEARYLREEQACHPKFFATSCIEDAKERRRLSLYALRPVEVEANTFKRRARVAERDEALAERLANAEKDRAERAGLLGPSGADTGAIPESTSSESVAIEDSSRKVQATFFPDRGEKRAAKQKPSQVSDAMEAEKRAHNIAAYEKKKRDALARQKKVAERKAEKERKRQEKQDGDPMPE